MKRIVKDLKKLCDRADEAILADEEKLNENIGAIKEVLEKKKDIVALSAPQIGINARIFCIRFSGGDIRTFINPMITHTEGMHLSREKCVNIPDKEYIVVRHNDIEVAYQTPVGKTEQNLFQGTPSEVFQQMLNTLDGALISDFGLEVIDGWDDATDEERSKVIDMYLESLKEKSKELDEEISNDTDLKEINDAIEFMTGVATGKIHLEKSEPKKPEIKLNREQRRIAKQLEKKFKNRGAVSGTVRVQ